MKGRRLPDLTEDADGRSPIQQNVQGGDYWKLTLRGGLVEWYCQPPGGKSPNAIGGLGLHKVVENEDGTITVSPSILSTYYHGFLKDGVWSSA